MSHHSNRSHPRTTAQPTAAGFDAMDTNNTTASGPTGNRTTGRNGASRQGGRLSADSIGWYLSNIGRVPLLTPAEEIELAHHVQGMKLLLQLPRALRQVQSSLRLNLLDKEP